MTRSSLMWSAILAALAPVGGADAQSTTQKPMVQISVKSAKDLITKGKDLTKSVMEAAGQDAMWPMIEGGLAQVVGKEGEKLPGLDVTKPIGLRVMYKTPVGATPIDGDVLVAIPTTDASKFLQQGLPMLRLNPMPGQDGLTVFQITGSLGGMAREKDGYVFITVADASVIAADRLPKPSDVTGPATHDLSLIFSPAAFPEKSIRQFFDWSKSVAPGAPPTPESSIQQIVETETIEYHYDLDPSSGKVLFEMVQNGKPGSKLESMFKASRPGPLQSSIGIAPNAIATAGMRGEWVAQGRYLPALLQQIKALPQVQTDQADKMVLDLLEEVTKGEIEDISMSVSADGTTIFAAALTSAAAFELKIGETVDKLAEEIAKDAGDQAAKVKERTKRKAATVAGVELARVWAPIPDKKPADAVNIYIGVKDKIAIVAVAFTDSTSTLEAAFKQPVMDSFDPASMTVKLKGLAEAFEVDYKGSAEVKMTCAGGNPFRWKMEVPAKDIGELFKLGLGEKLKERFEK